MEDAFAGGLCSSAWRAREEATATAAGLRSGASPRGPPLSGRKGPQKDSLPFDPSVPNVHLGFDCEKEIDRLVREKLEGRNTDRTRASAGFARGAEYMDTWQGRVGEVTRSGGWALLEGLVQNVEVGASKVR